MFSVVIPYYKKRKYIERCIDAVLAQTYQDFEIILVDDGSQDDVAQLIKEKYSGKVHLIQQENQGVSAARNTGIAAATHDYIAFLDADDYWSPFYLVCNAEIINNETDVKIIGSHYTRNKSELELTKNSLDYFKFENYFKTAIRNTYFTSSSTIIRNVFFQNNPGFNSNLKRGEDIDVWFRAVASGGNAFYIKNSLVYYSDEDDQQATKKEFLLQDSIIYSMKNRYDVLANQYDNPKISEFADRFIRSRLVSYYYQKENHSTAKEVLKKIGSGDITSRLIYGFPLRWGAVLFSSKLGRKILKLAIR